LRIGRIAYLSHGVDVDVVLSLLRVGNERLNQELAKNTGDSLNLDLLASTSLNPLSGLGPGLVQSEQTTLTPSLNQLIWLSDELGAGSQQPRVDNLRLVQDILHSGVFREVDGGKSGRRVVGGGRRERSRLDDRSPGEVVVEDGLAISFENRLGGYDDRNGGSERRTNREEGPDD
jgi:hypothetical protein